MLRFLRHMHLEAGWQLEEVLPLMTRNPASILKLRGKGRIAVGCAADILLLQVSHSSAGHWDAMCADCCTAH